MSIRRPRTPKPLLCLAVAALTLAPAVWAQDSPQQGQAPDQNSGQNQGQGRGYGRGMGGEFGPGMNGTIGTVSAISGSDITVKNEQGDTWKIATSPNTHIRKDREEAKLSDIHVGDTVMAAGNLDETAKTVGAVFLVVLDAQQAARMEKMRADFGKTWTAGRVTAINTDALTITVERPDKVTQTIAVDENTTFHKRGPNGDEDVTFPDIKVGDRVRANGSVQGANFLATNLSVTPPGGRGPGRFGHGEGGAEGGNQANPDTKPAPQPESTPTGTTAAQPQNAPQN
ncbi:MAG: DUF5666 domain-containing protein [Acidobacteriaceae bacterium]